MGAIGGEEMLHWEKMQRQDSSSSGAGAPGIGDGGGGERICVSVRLRPLNEKEIARSDVSDWECIDDHTIMFRNSLPERSMFPSAYTFDRVFRSDCSTRQVYEEAAKQVALSVVSGINSSIFAYGQTSSGKTYTMTGITDYTIADIYDYIQKHGERAFVLKFSAIEIYNEAVRDLLNPDGAQLRLLDDPDKGTIVEKLTEETLRGWNHMKELLSICEAQRQIGETSLNEASSRSHQILRLTVESSAREFLGKDNSSTLAASVNFVDLAGSERASQALSAGTRLKEGCHINRSLLTLGTVIRKLSKGRNTHIPYRDSKLTRILQPSLGGNGRTAIICTMSPARSHLEQSRNTLLFASCAKQVTTNAQVNIVMSDKVLVKRLQKELARLESELRNTGAPSVTSRSSDALLREKNAQILKMERVIQELSEQRDLVQSQLDDLLRVVGDNHTTRLWEFGDPPPFHDLNQYDDNLSVSESSGVIDQSPDFGFEYLSSSNKDENFLLSSELQKQHSESSPRIAADVSSFAESNPQCGVEISYGNRKNDFLEPCKDVECIEVEELSHCRNNNNSASLPGDDEEFLPSIDTKNTAEMIELASEPNAKVDREVIELEQRSNVKLEKEVRELGSDTNEKTDRNSKHVGRDVTYDALEQQLQNVQKPLINFVRLLPDEPSPWTQSYLRRSRSCRASLMNNITSFWFEHSEQNENTPPTQFVKDFPPIPKAFERRPCSLNYRSEVRTLSRADSHASEQRVSPDVPKPQSTDEGSEENITSIYSCVADVKETVQREYDDQAIGCQETEQKGDVNIGQPKILKDVGLDPMQITTSPSSPMTFENQQEKIIMLWHENNVPLKHRSTFFLLFFNGDPADAIYMEVELRTQSFLKKAFSGDNVTRRDGPIITRASSLRALRRERERLSRRMETRLTPEEREDLYKQWGIGLDTKQRKLQLAHRLWTDPNNMEHIKESVALVKKLEGLFEFGEPSKEMFGLSFSPQMRRRSFSWKNGMSSLL